MLDYALAAGFTAILLVTMAIVSTCTSIFAPEERYPFPVSRAAAFGFWAVVLCELLWGSYYGSFTSTVGRFLFILLRDAGLQLPLPALAERALRAGAGLLEACIGAARRAALYKDASALFSLALKRAAPLAGSAGSLLRACSSLCERAASLLPGALRGAPGALGPRARLALAAAAAALLVASLYCRAGWAAAAAALRSTGAELQRERRLRLAAEEEAGSERRQRLAAEKEASLLRGQLGAEKERALGLARREVAALARASAAAASADVFRGHYVGPGEILEQDLVFGAELGKGGYGVVHRGTWCKWPVALKTLRTTDDSGRPVAVTDARILEFETEVKALLQLSHPCVARVYGVCHLKARGSGARNVALVEELAEQSLAAKCRGGLPAREAAQLGAEVASGLAYIHSRGVSHNDLKPGNVLCFAHGPAKLADFGTVRALRKLAGPSDVVLAEETGIGAQTSCYAAPETNTAAGCA